MKRIVCMIAILFCLMGCQTVEPLSLRYYRRNLILDKDCCLKVEKFEATGVELQEINIANLQQELAKRLITTSSPITLHVHRYTADVAFEEVYKKLKDEGYWNLEFTAFRDPDPPQEEPVEKKK